ncbi:MAG TPA: 30S ribosomal protein S17, partial [Candidatus Methanomethylophilaceae archaeon]|nr:30S ribosomal protein S17 [Candidatus Methanomethylophilaceae archaeon]
MENKTRDIGIDVNPPASTCNDPHCPFHGKMSVRGRIINGKVVSVKMDRTAVVERNYLRYQKKYERFEKRTSRYAVHAPPCMELKVGDDVRRSE